MKKLPKSLTTPDFSGATMWAATRDDFKDFCRLRIIYPSGRAQWFNGVTWGLSGPPCWGLNDNHKWLPKTPQESVKGMKAYDKRMDFKTLFMGNI